MARETVTTKEVHRHVRKKSWTQTILENPKRQSQRKNKSNNYRLLFVQKMDWIDSFDQKICLRNNTVKIIRS